MPTPTPDRIRTVAVVGHSHDGKTTLCEALLHTAGATQRLGSTDQGTSILDHEPEEQRRSISIASAVAHADWDGTRINLIDAPGFQDFAGEVVQALAGADAAMLVLSATGTVPVGAELAWELVTAAGLPSLVVVNKMDKENAAYEATVDAVRSVFGRACIAVAVPIGAAEGFRGYIDLVDDRAYEFDNRGRAVETGFPEELRAEVERAHSALVDAAAETDDALLEKYLEGTELTDDEVRTALHAAIAKGTLIPIVCSAAAQEKGASLVLDAIVRYLPSPRERVHRGTDAKGNDVAIECDPAGKLCAQVFKTTVDTFGKVSFFKVLRGTFTGDSHPFTVRLGQDQRFAQLGQPMGKAIVTLSEVGREDIAFSVDRDPVTNEVLVHGLGDVHLDVALERMKRKYGVEAALNPPRIPYRETITGTARVAHKYKKQSGGAGLYGDATIEIEPLPRGGGYEWEDKIFGGSIPHQFRPSVEKGVR